MMKRSMEGSVLGGLHSILVLGGLTGCALQRSLSCLGLTACGCCQERCPVCGWNHIQDSC